MPLFWISYSFTIVMIICWSFIFGENKIISCLIASMGLAMVLFFVNKTIHFSPRLSKKWKISGQFDSKAFFCCLFYVFGYAFICVNWGYPLLFGK
jgi:ABC-type nickel/cobalt efflux system permease component RcnA